MEKYTHGQFQITGYKITTTNKDGQSGKDIKDAWMKFGQDFMTNVIQHQAYPTVHVVYYNYTNPENVEERGYDMLIGYVTEEGSVQENPDLTTVVIPEQNYLYETVKTQPYNLLFEKWEEINKAPKSEIDRTYGFDMDMFNEDRTEITVTVSVK
jgi:predicted transcriptional regulator YdeE